jgi:hypothetical protein
LEGKGARDKGKKVVAEEEGGGQLVEGGGNAGIAPELAAELAAFRARAARPPMPKAGRLINAACHK